MTTSDERKADEISDEQLEEVSGGTGPVVRAPNSKSTNAKRVKGEKGGTEDINIGVGELQECTISKSSD